MAQNDKFFQRADGIEIVSQTEKIASTDEDN
jgi:hypothetical protein